MKTKTVYSTNPRFLKTKTYFNDAGERDAVSVCSRMGDTESETLYLYREGKRKLGKRVERRETKTTEFLYPALTGKPVRIKEKYHPKGRTVSTTTYNGNWEEIAFQWCE